MPEWSRVSQNGPGAVQSARMKPPERESPQGRVGDVLFLGGKSQSWLRALLCSVQRRVFLALLVTNKD